MRELTLCRLSGRACLGRGCAQYDKWDETDNYSCRVVMDRRVVVEEQAERGVGEKAERKQGLE